MKTKDTFLLIFLVLAAIILSALVTSLTSGVDALKWLTWGEGIGFDAVQPDLSIINISLSLHMQVNVVQVVLITAALLLYRKVR